MKKNIDNVQQPHILIKGRIMKILMINGSPRRTGNTALALQALEKKLQADHEVELLQSYSMTVTPCLACLECKKMMVFAFKGMIPILCSKNQRR